MEVDVIKTFLSNTGSILFLIEASNARDINNYTSFPNEHEVILPPGTQLRVIANAMDHSNMQVVHLREVTGEEQPVSSTVVAGEYEERRC